MSGDGSNGAVTDANGGTTRRRRNRWGEAPSAASNPTTTTTVTVAAPASNGGPAATTTTTSMDARAKALALQESIRQRLAALKSKTAVLPAATVATTATTTASAIHKRPAPETDEATSSKKAKYYDLDLSVTGPSFQPKPAVPKVNPYLSNPNEVDENAIMDERLVRASKPRQRHKALTFVEPGTFVEIGERKRIKAANAIESGFFSGRKAGIHVHATGISDVYGHGPDYHHHGSDELTLRADANPDTPMPQVMEWWDIELLPSKLKKQVATQEGKALSRQTQAQLLQLGTSTESSNATTTTTSDELQSGETAIQQLQTLCFEQASLAYSKTAALVQHIVPIQTVSEGPAKPPTLHLTKKEMKRQRKLRRAEKQRELQDLQAAGLIPPPEPRLTLKNFIQVMGDQAFLDPSQMEQKVQEQMQARQRTHLERNEAKKLTKEQRSEKRTKKLQEDTTQGVTVALFFVKDMSHPYHRTKVDLNAQQNNITGCVLECQNPSMACVICEGGQKAIQRYTRLMLVRMKWTGTDDANDDDDDDNVVVDGEERTHKFNQDNKCELVWTGMGAKRLFKSFMFQSCETADMARKVLESKGVAHFWDQVLIHASGNVESFRLKLGNEDGNSDADVVMED